MRQFTSYGPVEPGQHFAAPRTALVEQCVSQLLGAIDSAQRSGAPSIDSAQRSGAPSIDSAQGGHYFTIWAPRQTGKTWLMRRAREEILARHGDRFGVVTLTLQRLMKDGDPDEVFLSAIPSRLKEALGVSVPPLGSFEDWPALFRKQGGLFDRPTILMIDEFDGLTASVIDNLVALFRQMYLTRSAYHVHGLALVGVRAVLGVAGDRGSPFNVQRALRVPNLSCDEVVEMFRQYQIESGQPIEEAVVQRVYAVTRGQPGLVGWFGELLTEKHNRAAPGPITLRDWNRVYLLACRAEPNNTVLNLLKKARDRRYVEHVVELFKTGNVPFSFDEDWCNYLYLNGVLDYEEVETDLGEVTLLCRFSSPFVQHRLFAAFSRDMAELVKRVPAVDPRQDLTGILRALDLPALLQHYRDYLRRAKRSGHNPWQGHPGRADLHLREAVGHFHLYWWLTEACAGLYLITPEFPTGNGKVDLHLRCGPRSALIEVKSFTTQAELPAQKAQVARYAKSRDLSEATLALFVPSDDEELLEALTVEDDLDAGGGAVRVRTVAIAAV